MFFTKLLLYTHYVYHIHLLEVDSRYASTTLPRNHLLPADSVPSSQPARLTLHQLVPRVSCSLLLLAVATSQVSATPPSLIAPTNSYNSHLCMANHTVCPPLFPCSLTLTGIESEAISLVAAPRDTAPTHSSQHGSRCNGAHHLLSVQAAHSEKTASARAPLQLQSSSAGVEGGNAT